jgi:hypothetical protein
VKTKVRNQSFDFKQTMGLVLSRKHFIMENSYSFGTKLVKNTTKAKAYKFLLTANSLASPKTQKSKI